MKLNNSSYITGSEEETKRIGEELAKSLIDGRFIALFGELGSGKTTFVQGLAKGSGIKKRIISPTFIILRSYKTPDSDTFNFYHIDLYRAEGNEKEMINLGLAEIINDKKNIIVVEWAEKMKKLLPKKRWEISFEYIDENKRRIKITRRN